LRADYARTDFARPHHGLDISPRLQAAARGDILLHNLGGR
jgi:hypothetical protein